MPIGKGKGGLPMNKRKTGPADSTASRARSTTGRNMAGRKAGKVGKGPK